MTITFHNYLLYPAVYPVVNFFLWSFNTLLATREMVHPGPEPKPESAEVKVLYVTGNYSVILSRLGRRFEALEIRRGFTVFQLRTILEEAHYSLIFAEHDPLLCKDAREMTEYVLQAQREAAKEAAVVLYTPGGDVHLNELVNLIRPL